MTIMTDCFKMTFVSAVFMAVLISLVFKKLILVIVEVNNSHKINKTVSCLAKTQPQLFLSNGVLDDLMCECAYLLCLFYNSSRIAFGLLYGQTRHCPIFQKRPFLIAFSSLIDMWELLFRRVR